MSALRISSSGLSPGRLSVTPALAVTTRLLPGQLERFGERAEDALGLLLEVLDGRLVLEEDRELVAAEARDRVAGTYRVAEAIADCEQQLVADGVTEAVVHRLEAVEVDDDDPDGAVVAGSACECVLHAIREQRPVREIRERVVECPVPQLPLEAIAFGHVLDRGQHRGAALEVESVRSDVDLDGPAVFQNVTPRHRAVMQRGRDGDLFEKGPDVVGRTDIGHTHRQELFARVPVVLDRCRVHLEEVQVFQVEDPHRLRVLQEELAEARFLIA